MLEILNIKGKSDNIINKRQEISKLFLLKSHNIKNTKITAISPSDMYILFQLYDEIFFNNWFKDNFEDKMKFSISKRMTKSAAITMCPKNIDKINMQELVIEIRIGIDFFFHYSSTNGEKAVGGINTQNSLEALQLVFEHELCHVIEFIQFKKSNCKGKQFKTIASNLFGHIDSYHKLPTYKEIAKENLGLRIGDTVSFEFEEKTLIGFINNINKRATVMVRNNKGQLVDKQGFRYSKYYVPLNVLKKN